MNTAIATYTSMSNLGTPAFPIWTAFKEQVDAEGYDIETATVVLYQGPDKAKAIEACGDTFGFDKRKAL